MKDNRRPVSGKKLISVQPRLLKLGLSSRRSIRAQIAAGFTLLELVIALALSAILFSGLGGLSSMALNAYDSVHAKNELTRQARFAMNQMVRGIANSEKLMLPQPENPNTTWPESVREFPPRTAFPKETAVLAFFLDPTQDLDGNGFPDADNDNDGKINEDPGGDSTFDEAAGLLGIDDDNDGNVDEEHTLPTPGGTKLGPAFEDDDEDGMANEDLIDGIDDDADGNFDEDIKKQTDGNGLSGIGGVDDDGDGFIDEDPKNDDDEDGIENEDWYDVVVFYLDNGVLMQRVPVPWNANPIDVAVNGKDFVTKVIAENVSALKFERVNDNGQILVYLTLSLTSPDTKHTITLATHIRVAGAL